MVFLRELNCKSVFMTPYSDKRSSEKDCLMSGFLLMVCLTCHRGGRTIFNVRRSFENCPGLT